MTPRKDNSRDERGTAMIYVALFLLSSIWFVSLAIDMGKLTVTKNELQRAADAAALAGASAVDVNGKIIQADARVKAAFVASQNTALREGSEAVVIDPQADIQFLDDYTIRVAAHRDASNGNAMTTIFAQTLGIGSLNVAAHAIAKVRPTNKPCNNLQPFGVVNQPGGFDKSCGSKVQLKTSKGPQQGNFQLVDFPGCDEGDCANLVGQNAQLTCYINTGYGCCVGLGDHLTDSEPGNKVGIVKPALDARFNSDTDTRTNICYQQYLADKRGNNRRIIFTPIIDNFDVNGKKGVNVVGFAAFFLLQPTDKGGPGNFVLGQFIDYIVPGEATNQPPANNQLFTLKLIE